MDTSSIGLPEEVIELILSRCPAKSVLRFKAVSKPWQSIISDPRFPRARRVLQSSLSENQNKFLVWAKPNSALTRIYVIRLEDGRFRRESTFPYQSQVFFFPLCSCNGLFLLCSDPNNHKYMMWNPSIRKNIIIHGLKPETNHLPSLYHFYYDSAADDHKIVFVYEDRYAVYSCRSGRWGERDLPCHIGMISISGAAVDGCFYGLSGAGELVCFDARDGNLHKFWQPRDFKGDDMAKVELRAVDHTFV